MKITGLSLLSVLIIFAGNSFAKRKTKRIELLDCISLMIKAINSQIVYSRMSVPKLLDFIENSEEFSELRFVKRAKEMLADGSDYKTAWHKATQEYMISFPVAKEDVEMLTAFFNGLGSTDIEGQKSNCETYADLFELKANGLRKKAEASAKLYNCFGMLTAALVFIILY